MTRLLTLTICHLTKMGHTLKLNNGREIPIVGLGTYKSPPGQVQEAVKAAISCGYRHIDCAWFYENEAEVGQGIHAKIADGTINREDIFITSKLWNNFHAKNSVVPMLRDSLKKLGLDYVDLYLIHWPMGFKETAPPLPPDASGYSDVDYLETWQGMEECVKLGLAKSIGLSNFNSEQIERVLQKCTIKPVVNQVEVNPNINQKKLIKFCKDRDIVVVGFCPLGRSNYVGLRPNFPSPTIHDPKVIEMGKKYNKTPAQVVLNYLVSLGISVIPKSVTPSRIEENINIFDFQLHKDDIAYLDSCNKNQRCSPQSNHADHKYFPFNIEF
ncbi:aldo-keto reductase family 1 member B1-like [Tribolium madens]|uniref:aldo-keto reductase family 1 member B1-like n=1 Tax=Tribolium madens TaxID=41895 RepID=UPI001CF76369|nr:aldo-keto reductase family 1 member B1-like [Tribolium madens]